MVYKCKVNMSAHAGRDHVLIVIPKKTDSVKDAWTKLYIPKTVMSAIVIVKI